jgi:hypothetical protein
MDAPMAPSSRGPVVGLIVKAAMFVLFEIVGLVLFARLLSPFGPLVAATLSVFLAAVIANFLAMRIYERSSLAEVGFAWDRSAQINLLLGLGCGMVAAGLVVAVPLLAGLARFQFEANPEAGWPAMLFASVLLLFGAAGEEMFFRGYAFQLLMGRMGVAATILPVAVLFAAAHSENLNISRLGVFNTFLWGVLLGFAFWRSGGLWLPIGLHFGWNWVLPMTGVYLSGFTMRVTEYAVRWNAGPLWSGGEYGPEGGVPTSVVVTLLFVLLWRLPVRRQFPLLLRGPGEA